MTGPKIAHSRYLAFSDMVQPGGSDIQILKRANLMECNFDGEVWIPDEEMGTGDLRSISLHLTGMTFG